MERDPDVFVIGEDVGQFGGAFKVTKGFLDKYGPRRVVDTPIAETGFTETTKVGDLPAHHLADFANTVFHEARHAEQRFLMARLAVGYSMASS